MEIAVIGDIGGNVKLLKDILSSFGGDIDSVSLPDNVIVVQVGDLIRLTDEGLSGSSVCVEIIDRFLDKYPGRWVQLWGNHDMGAIGGPIKPDWSKLPLPEKTRVTIKRWWDTGSVKFAAGIYDGEREFLITHAGLTYHRWRQLGKPNLHDVVKYLNSTVGGSVGDSINPGFLVTGVINNYVDCTWAAVNSELYYPWLEASINGEMVPFQQIHGHACPWSWRNEDWVPDTPELIKDKCLIDFNLRHTTTTVGSLACGIPATMLCVDLGFESASPNGSVSPLLMSVGDDRSHNPII